MMAKRRKQLKAVKGLIYSPNRSECMCSHVQAAEIARNPELKASHERLLAAWQSALPLIFPKLKVACPQPHFHCCYMICICNKNFDDIYVSALAGIFADSLVRLVPRP